MKDVPPNAAKQAGFRGTGLANPYFVSEVPPLRFHPTRRPLIQLGRRILRM
jgi:hypothetical protein